MKILQLSDLHVVEPDSEIYHPDPLARLEQAVEHINHYHSDAYFCAVTGDIADNGSLPAYRAVKHTLDKLKLPYYPIIGNHDLRRTFSDVFTTISTENCFIQYRINIDNTVFLFLDTVIENHDHGELCTQRVKWLEEQLENIAPGQQLILFMHHPPLSVSLPWMDAVMLNNSQIFYDIIKDHRIGYVFFGHVHRPVHGIWRGIPYASSRSIGQYQISSHNEQAYRFPVNRESPMYSVISLLNGQIHIDLMDFTNDKVVEQ